MKLGQPLTSKNDKTVKKDQSLVRSDLCLSNRHMVSTIRVPYGLVQSILKNDLEMRCVCAKVVPRILTEEQMENKKLIATKLFEQPTN